MTALPLKNLLISILKLSNDHLVCHARLGDLYQPKKSPSCDNKRVEIKTATVVVVVVVVVYFFQFG